MKKSFLLLLVIAIPFFSEAQAQPGVSLNDRTKPAEIKITDTLQEGDLSNINWGGLINRDFVAIGEKFHDVHVLDPGWIIQVRFYGKGMTPLINQQRDGGKSLPFTKTDDSRIVAVEGMTDGGIKVILATGDRIGPFVETMSLKSGFYSFTCSIKGLVQSSEDKDKETAQ